jgi:hypothetical protein
MMGGTGLGALVWAMTARVLKAMTARRERKKVLRRVDWLTLGISWARKKRDEQQSSCWGC